MLLQASQPSRADRLATVQRQVDEAHGQLQLLQEQWQAAQVASSEALAASDIVEQAGQLLRLLGARQRDTLQQMVEPLCTSALQDIFGPEAEFKLEFSQTSSGRYKASIRTRAGEFLGPPAATDGGSVCEILSVVLRIAFLMMHHPRLSPVLVLDEPLGNLDEEKVPAFAAFLEDVCDRLQESGTDLQVICAVHLLAESLAPYAERVWDVKMTDNGSIVKEAVA